MQTESFVHPTYAPLVEACKAHGIGRTQAFALVQRGLLESFLIGNRRFVRLDSLARLPEKLAVEVGAARL